ncbi:MAG: hypothetical protein Kow0075_04350 [Salibacteraceae bacterium]
MPFSLSLLFLVVFTACETDIDVIKPDEDVTIIYGLLEANKTIHFIRINKSFVGEKPASELAAINGINEYDDDEIIVAQVQEIDGNDNIIRAWDLKDTIYTNKEEGAFANESNKAYYFEAKLNVDYRYRLFCEIEPHGHSRKVVTAVTNIVGTGASGQLQEVVLETPRLSVSSSSNGGTDRTRDEVKLVNNNGYATSYKVLWSTVSGAYRAQSYARMYYREKDSTNGTSVPDSITLPIGSKSINSIGQIEFNFNTSEWYFTIGSNLSDIDVATSPVRRHVNDTLQFYLELSNKELATYIEINQPVTGVLLDRPQYTNVSNGIGIFASRLIVSTRRKDYIRSGRILDNRSLEELLYSNLPESAGYTAGKGLVKPGRCFVLSTGPTCL